MLISLTLKNFLKHARLDIVFPKPGLTAITGPNATGKSTILMAIRYALFGAAALNGKVEDVKGGEVKLVFAVRGETYAVIRKGASATLCLGIHDVLAVGAKAVNAKVQEILGFGLPVFDAGVCANQGSIEALSAMRPAERKRLVDETLGLGVLDEIAKWCAEEASATAREAEAVRRNLIQLPPEPVEPQEGDKHLALRIKELRAWVRELDDAEAVVRLEVTNPGPEPTSPWIRFDYEHMLQHNAERMNLVQQRERLADERTKISVELMTRLDAPWVTHFDIITEYVHALEIMRSAVRPTMTAEEIELAKVDHDMVALYGRWQKLHGKGTHTCPSCNHSWPVAASEIGQLGADFSDGPPPEPRHSWPQIREAERLLATAEAERQKVEAAQATVTKLLLSHPILRDPFDQITTTRELVFRGTLIENTKKDQAVVAKMQAITTELDRFGPAFNAQMIDQVKQAHAQHRRWLVEKQHFDAWSAKAAVAAMIIQGRLGSREALEAALALQTAWTTYRAGKAAYDRQKAALEAQEADVARLEKEAGEWRRAREAMASLRSRVKSYLVPSLSAAASVVVSRMTGGRRVDVRVTEDFEITVDGQPVETLSGSEKAAANLALRLALGQVLTARVFPVFMADEPDAAMDPERAELCAQTLRGLDKNLEQVVLVTHKNITADLVVELGG